MPTPYSAIAEVAATLGEFDPSDDGRVQLFYTEEYPRYTESVRTFVFEWLVSLDQEPAPAEIRRFHDALRSHPDFGKKSAINPFKVDDPSPDTPTRPAQHYAEM